MESGLRIGARLKHARKVKRLTLKELSTVVGCSESLLSKIENEKITPSLQMLHKIVGKLDITIGHLMEGGSRDGEVVTRKGRRPVLKFEENQLGDGTQIEWLIPQTGTELLQASIHIVVPGAGSKGRITHDGEEMGYVLEGSLTIDIGDETYEVGEGDSFFFQSHIPHGYINNGSKVAKILWATTPPTF
ncbi:MAG: cupin domain-containing protein [Pseudomonadota bacterium]